MGWEGPVTNRQLLVWGEYFRLEMERPSRSDFYLMRIAFEAFYSQRKYPDKIDLEPFRLSFEGKAKKKPAANMDKRTASALFKAQFTTALGLLEFDIQETEPPACEIPPSDADAN